MTKVSKTEKNPLISVIIPVYNVEDYLDKCLESVVNQTYKNLEIILIDDGSTDSSGKICDAWAKKDKRIKVIHQKNGGVSIARNVGLKNAKGEYINFVDSDDTAHPKYIEILYKDLIKHNCDLAMIKHYIIYPLKKINTATNRITVFDNPKPCLEQLLYIENIDTAPWGKLYKKSLFEGIEYPKGKIFEDTAITYKIILKSSKTVLDSKPLYDYMFHPKSISHQIFHSAKLDLISSTKNMTKEIIKIYPDLASACDCALSHSYLSTLRVIAVSKKPDKKIRDKLINELKPIGKIALKDPRFNHRERIMLKILNFSWPIFSLCCKIYERSKK